jgi:hypothetical protein
MEGGGEQDRIPGRRAGLDGAGRDDRPGAGGFEAEPRAVSQSRTRNAAQRRSGWHARTARCRTEPSGTAARGEAGVLLRTAGRWHTRPGARAAQGRTALRRSGGPVAQCLSALARPDIPARTELQGAGAFDQAGAAQRPRPRRVGWRCAAAARLWQQPELQSGSSDALRKLRAAGIDVRLARRRDPVKSLPGASAPATSPPSSADPAVGLRGLAWPLVRRRLGRRPAAPSAVCRRALGRSDEPLL